MKIKTISTKKAIDMAADYITVYDIDLFLWIINGASECNKEHAAKKDGIYRSLREVLEHVLEIYVSGKVEQNYPYEQIQLRLWLEILPKKLLESYIK